MILLLLEYNTLKHLHCMYKSIFYLQPYISVEKKCKIKQKNNIFGNVIHVQQCVKIHKFIIIFTLLFNHTMSTVNSEYQHLRSCIVQYRGLRGLFLSYNCTVLLHDYFQETIIWQLFQLGHQIFC